MKKLTLSLLCLCSINSFAGILAERTRVIYLEGQREVTLMLNNTNSYPIMTQVWVDDGISNPDTTQAPFLVLAPIFKMQPEETKGIRIILTKDQLPKDRESLFWLNLYEIPAVDVKKLDENYVNLSMNTQMKVIYRPKLLKNFNIQNLQKQLKFLISNDASQIQLHIENPSPYYVSLASLMLNFHKETLEYTDLENLTLKPQESKIITFQPQSNVQNNPSLQYVLIDDDGQYHEFEYVP